MRTKSLLLLLALLLFGCCPSEVSTTVSATTEPAATTTTTETTTIDIPDLPPPGSGSVIVFEVAADGSQRSVVEYPLTIIR